MRSGQTEFHYEREVQPFPKLGAWKDELERLLAANATKPARERLTLIRVFEVLRAAGYEGGYDAIRRYSHGWHREQAAGAADAYVPLSFAPGEAYQFDWSHEIVVIAGAVVTVKVAHFRLCHSRMLFVRAYPRETQEMVFDAHDRAFAFFRGACTRGIYDNMKTAVDAIFVGRDRAYNRRFLQMCSHYLVEPVACTPAAGWEKGQVENQVGLVRERFFTPRLRVTSFEELNAWLLDQCVAYARAHRHPELREQTIWSVFEDERPTLVPYAGRFDGFHAVPASVSKTCLVRFDNNRYSVSAHAVGRPAGACLRRADRIAPGRPPGRRTSPLLRPRSDRVRSLALRAGAGAQAGRAAQRRPVQGLAAADGTGTDSPQARRQRRWRPADGRDPDDGAERWLARGRGRLSRGAARGRPLRRRRAQHPGPAPRAGNADHDSDARGAAVAACAGGRLRPIRQLEENQ